MDSNNCIVFINGEQPVFADKNWCNNHEDFAETGDFNPDLIIQVDDLMKCSNKRMTGFCKEKIDEKKEKPNEEFEQDQPEQNKEGSDSSESNEIEAAAIDTMEAADASYMDDIKDTFSPKEDKSDSESKPDEFNEDEQLIEWGKPKTKAVNINNVKEELSGAKEYKSSNPDSTLTMSLKTSLSNIPQDYTEEYEDDFKYPGRKKGGK